MRQPNKRKFSLGGDDEEDSEEITIDERIAAMDFSDDVKALTTKVVMMRKNQHQDLLLNSSKRPLSFLKQLLKQKFVQS